LWDFFVNFYEIRNGNVIILSNIAQPRMCLINSALYSMNYNTVTF